MLLLLEHPLVVLLLLIVVLRVIFVKKLSLVCRSMTAAYVMVDVVAHVARFLLAHAIVVPKLRIRSHYPGQVLLVHIGRRRSCNLLSSVWATCA